MLQIRLKLDLNNVDIYIVVVDASAYSGRAQTRVLRVVGDSAGTECRPRARPARRLAWLAFIHVQVSDHRPCIITSDSSRVLDVRSQLGSLRRRRPDRTLYLARH